MEGVDPLSSVHPENELVARFMLLVQRFVPSDPLTTVHRVFCRIVAAGVSIVVPEDNAVHVVQVCVAMVSVR